MPAPSLRELQSWMRWVSTDPRGVPEALTDQNPKDKPARYQAPEVSALSAISANGRALREDRLSIYAEAYFARLLGVAGTHFPHTQRALGNASFAKAVNEYLKRYPSQTANIDFAFNKFADSLEPDEISDLARAEWLLSLTAFSTRADEELDLHKLAQIVNWSGAKLIFRTDVSFLQTRWRIEKILAGEDEAKKEPGNYIFFFSDSGPRVEVLQSKEAALLLSLESGLALDQALQAQEVADQDLVTTWFTKWMNWKIIKDIEG